VFSYLQRTAAAKPCENECCLVVDAMNIRKDSSWDKNSGKFVGHVDYGGLMEESDRGSCVYGSGFKWSLENVNRLLLY